MEILDNLQKEFIRKYLRKDFIWLADIAIVETHQGHWFWKSDVQSVTDIEEVISQARSEGYPDNSLHIGPSLGKDGLPSEALGVSLYTTQAGILSPQHQEYLRSQKYSSEQ